MGQGRQGGGGLGNAQFLNDFGRTQRTRPFFHSTCTADAHQLQSPWPRALKVCLFIVLSTLDQIDTGTGPKAESGPRMLETCASAERLSAGSEKARRGSDVLKLRTLHRVLNRRRVGKELHGRLDDGVHHGPIPRHLESGELGPNSSPQHVHARLGDLQETNRRNHSSQLELPVWRSCRSGGGSGERTDDAVTAPASPAKHARPAARARRPIYNTAK